VRPWRPWHEALLDRQVSSEFGDGGRKSLEGLFAIRRKAGLSLGQRVFVGEEAVVFGEDGSVAARFRKLIFRRRPAGRLRGMGDRHSADSTRRQVKADRLLLELLIPWPWGISGGMDTIGAAPAHRRAWASSPDDVPFPPRREDGARGADERD